MPKTFLRMTIEVCIELTEDWKDASIENILSGGSNEDLELFDAMIGEQTAHGAYTVKSHSVQDHSTDCFYDPTHFDVEAAERKAGWDPNP